MEITLNHGETICCEKICDVKYRAAYSLTGLVTMAHMNKSRRSLKTFTHAIACQYYYAILIECKMYNRHWRVFVELHPTGESANNRINELWKLNLTVG